MCPNTCAISSGKRRTRGRQRIAGLSAAQKPISARQFAACPEFSPNFLAFLPPLSLCSQIETLVRLFLRTGAGAWMCIFCLLGLLGCLLALGMPRAGRVLLWIAAFLALLGSAGMAGLFIYGYTPPRSYEFAYSIAGPVALSGLALFVAGLFSRRTQKQPQTPPQQAYSSSPTIPVAQW